MAFDYRQQRQFGGRPSLEHLNLARTAAAFRYRACQKQYNPCSMYTGGLVALATGLHLTTTATSPSLKLPIADLIVIIGVVIFGTDLLEVTLRGGPLEQFVSIIYIGLYAVGLGLALLSRAIPQALVRQPLMAILLLLPLLSAIWSIDPDTTFVRALMLFGTSTFGLFIGWHYERGRLLRLLAIGVSINLCISLGLIVAVPSIGIDSTTAWSGTWVGAFMHKNGFGAAVGLSILILFHATLSANGLFRLGFLAMLALAAVLLVGSQSATALVVTILALLLTTAFTLWRRVPSFMMALFIGSAVLLPFIAFALVNYFQSMLDLILEFLGKDLTATGRTEIWQLVWPYITDRFFFGYGYGSFWQSGFPWLSHLQARLYYVPHYSHNGIIELWLAGGVLMVLVGTLVYLHGLLNAFILAANERIRPDGTFAFVFLISFGFRNVTEASFLQSNDFFWLIFVASITSTTKSISANIRTTPTSKHD